MLVLINKYLSRSKNPAAGDDGEMPTPPANGAERERDYMCISGCVPVRVKRAPVIATTTITTTARTSRHNFVKSAASGLFPGAQFTNHESLPALEEAYSEFAAAFPQYAGLAQADAIRDGEYQHLDRHVCLDYTGINLFSHAQMNSSVPSTSASPPGSSGAWQPPFFDIAYKSTSLRSQVQCGDVASASGEGGIGGAVTRRVMASLNIPEDEYAMVCTANRTTAFRLLAESYSFHSHGKRLLTVYDYESEAAGAMAESARRRGAEVMSATFAWPGMRVHAGDLRKKLVRGRRRGHRGLFVFPLVSRMTGARYPYLWMSAAQEHGWHVALDACALGTKDLDTLGLSLLRPDFIVCNFFKVFGENPSGFAGLFVKKASLAALERSVIARSIGVVSIVPARRWSLHDAGYSTELDHSRSFADPAEDLDLTSSFSGPLSGTLIALSLRNVPEMDAAEENGHTPEIREADSPPATDKHPMPPPPPAEEKEMEVECRGLDHADALGLIAIGNRLRCISNWLVVAMQKLRHPQSEHGKPLVRVYGPRVKFERGPSVAFNVYDWKGEKVAPALVQKLADRHNISLTCGFLRNIWFADRYDADRAAHLEHMGGGGGKRKDTGGGGEMGIYVVNASLGFLSNFEDAYRLWAFVAKFLDADFVEKERWRYTALNQKTVEV
ncbi:molybdenum cofactor sulfurase [Oryza brachyantha]|uniref:molybdenum cofactor sulfurase n=1 Tax=Oryza brachyantha TaxID=4533 RepID=UPI001ADBB786|nr:molybdenum cofactor sulfurase [Oryza brachyantha]